MRSIDRGVLHQPQLGFFNDVVDVCEEKRAGMETRQKGVCVHLPLKVDIQGRVHEGLVRSQLEILVLIKMVWERSGRLVGEKLGFILKILEARACAFLNDIVAAPTT